MSTKIRGIVTASMEAYPDEPAVYLPSDTPEQETELVLQANDHLNGAVADDAEIDRMQDLAQGLEDLAEVGGTITQATPRELILIDIANQLSLAGSGMASEETLPGLESLEGKTVSVESIKETAAKLWNAVMAFIKRVWDGIQNFFAKLFSTLAGMKKKAEELKAAAKRTGNARPATAVIALGSEANALAVNHVAPHDGESINRYLGGLEAQCEVIFNAYVQQVDKAGKILTDLLSTADTSNQLPGNWFEMVSSAAGNLQFGQIKQALGCKEVSDARFAGGQIAIAPPLPGNNSIAFHRPSAQRFQEATQGGASHSDFAEFFQATYFEVIKTSDGHHDHSLGKSEFKVAATGDLVKVCDTVIKLCDIMLGYYNGASRRNIKSAMDTMGSLSQKLSRRVDNTPELHSHFRDSFNTSLRVLRAYNKWSTQPHAQLAKIAHSACRGALALVGRNLAAYEGRSGDPRQTADQVASAAPALAAPAAATA